MVPLIFLLRYLPYVMTYAYFRQPAITAAESGKVASLLLSPIPCPGLRPPFASLWAQSLTLLRDFYAHGVSRLKPLAERRRDSSQHYGQETEQRSRIAATSGTAYFNMAATSGHFPRLWRGWLLRRLGSAPGGALGKSAVQVVRAWRNHFFLNFFCLR